MRELEGREIMAYRSALKGSNETCGWRDWLIEKVKKVNKERGEWVMGASVGREWMDGRSEWVSWASEWGDLVRERSEYRSKSVTGCNGSELVRAGSKLVLQGIEWVKREGNVES